MRPQTRYARSGDLSIAYQVVGDGPFDIVFVNGFVSHLEVGWETPTFGAIYRRLSSFGRLILFDKRGVGLSERIERMPTLEERMDDVRAVMDAAGSERAAVIGISEGGPMALLFSATYPERTTALVLWATFARLTHSASYPDGFDPGLSSAPIGWSTASGAPARHSGASHCRTRRSSPYSTSCWGATSAIPPRLPRPSRRCASGSQTDVRKVLPAIATPTLVVFHSGDPLVPAVHGRYLAAHIRGARCWSCPATSI